MPFDIEHAVNPIAVCVLAHGAGAEKNHVFLNEMSALLLERNISVVRFNFPYMIKREEDGKRRPPDRFPKLLEHYKHVLANLDTRLPIFIGGKSMGSRVAATLLGDNEWLNEQSSIKGGFCIGYPFHPQKKPENLRLDPLQNTQKSILICQGDRDALGTKAEISTYEFSALCQLIYLPDGDHDIKPRVKSGVTHLANKITTANAIKDFILENG